MSAQQAVNVTLEHVEKRRGQIEELQRKMQELIVQYDEVVKRLGLDNWPTSIPELDYTREWLAIMRVYYAFLEIEERIRAGLVLNDEEWMNLKKRVDELSGEIYQLYRKNTGRLEELAIKIYRGHEDNGIRFRVYEQLPYAHVGMKSIVQGRDEIKKVLEELTSEMLAIEKARGN